MNDMDWLLAKFFKKTEAWGDPSQMKYSIIWLMDNIRSDLPNGCWIKVHSGFRNLKNDNDKGQHPKGTAIDFHIVGCSVLEAEAHIMKKLYNTGMLEYCGIGIYPQWVNPGFHLDTRGEKASWAKLNGEYVAYKLGLEYARKQLNGGK